MQVIILSKSRAQMRSGYSNTISIQPLSTNSHMHHLKTLWNMVIAFTAASIIASSTTNLAPTLPCNSSITSALQHSDIPLCATFSRKSRAPLMASGAAECSSCFPNFLHRTSFQNSLYLRRSLCGNCHNQLVTRINGFMSLGKDNVSCECNNVLALFTPIP
jgi:hypothetical protein